MYNETLLLGTLITLSVLFVAIVGFFFFDKKGS